MENLKRSNAFVPDFGVIDHETFSEIYPSVNSYILNQFDFKESRAGNTKEMMDVKTHLTNPYRRCVGGYGRDINVFFLIAEAMWIFNGRKDVKFLTFFNKKMADFSDDGEVFHAPYGFRLRHWGVGSEEKFSEENKHAGQGFDQIADAIKLLSENPDSRQVVLSIWNPDLDLGIKTKDLPCNDLLMLKIRNGKLISTIQNRSNDLHWGLPTNIFQFSFLTELMSGCLGIELGTQTHNSQSLHIYDWNKTAENMETSFNSGNGVELYQYAYEKKIDFKFDHTVPGNRLRELDHHIYVILKNLTEVANGELENQEEIRAVKEFSLYLWTSYVLCRIFLLYKKDLANAIGNDEKDALRGRAIYDIENIFAGAIKLDIVVLALNFFATRLSSVEHKYLGKL